MRTFSNVLFYVGSVVLLFAIISFELGLKAMKNKEDEKMKDHNRRGWKALLITAVLYGLSFLTAYFA
ncbi:hypothetical protein [Pseudothermotoga sp.]